MRNEIANYLSDRRITNHHFSEEGEAAFLCTTQEGINFTIEEPHGLQNYYKIFGIILQYYNNENLARLCKEKVTKHPDYIKVNDVCDQGCGFLFYEMTVSEAESDALIQHLEEFIDSFTEVLANVNDKEEHVVGQ